MNWIARLLLLAGLLGFAPALTAAEKPKLTFAGQELLRQAPSFHRNILSVSGRA